MNELRLLGELEVAERPFSPLFGVLLWINKFWVVVIDFGRPGLKLLKALADCKNRDSPISPQRPAGEQKLTSGGRPPIIKL